MNGKRVLRRLLILALVCLCFVLHEPSAFAAGNAGETPAITNTAAKGTLAAPKKIAAVRGDNTINIAWTKVEGASGYTLYRASSANGTYKALKSVSGTSTETAIPGSGKYYYKVRAYKNVKGERVYGAYSSAAAITELKAPGSLTAVQGDGVVNLGWKKVKGAVGYTIYRSAQKGGSYKPLKSVSGTTAQTAAPSSGTYYYKIRAYIEVGGQRVYGQYTAAAAITELKAPATVGAVKGDGGINLGWSKVKGAAGYTIYRSTSKNGEYKALKSIGTTTTQTAAPKSGTYFYKIRPYIEVAGKRLYGRTSAVTAILELTAPADLTGEWTVSGVDLKWKAVKGADGYSLRRRAHTNEEYMPLKSMMETSCRTAAPEIGDYYYTVRAYVLVGDQKLYGPSSKTAKVSTPFYMVRRGIAPCRYLTGDIVIVNVFVDTPSSSWTPAEIDEYYERFWKGVSMLTKQASSYGVSLHMSAVTLNATTSINSSFDSTDCYWQVIDQFGYDNMTEWHDAWVQRYGVDDMAFLLLFDEEARSYAYASTSDHPWREEYASVFCKYSNYWGDPGIVSMHELCHLFGAIDLYYPNVLTKAANKYLGRSLMTDNSPVIDNFTAYMLGWTNSLNKSALQFTQVINPLTREDLVEGK